MPSIQRWSALVSLRCRYALGLGERRARGDEQVARDGSQYTCFAVVAVLGSQRFDTIGFVPDRERRRATASLLHS